MSWTNVVKPTLTGYVNINPVGKTEYDGTPALVDQQQLETNGQIFWGDSSFEKIAQSFTPTVTANLARIEIQLRTNGNPTDAVQMGIYGNSGGVPGSLIQNATTTNATLDEENWTVVSFNFSGLQLSTGTVYWAVISRTGAQNSNNHYRTLYVNPSSYTKGDLSYYYSASWHSFTTEDIYFKEYYIDPATSVLTYDDSTTYYDGVNPSQWTDVDKPSGPSWTNISKPI